MNLNIDNSKKIEILNRALLEQESLVYESIVKSGYSPEEFDDQTFEVDEQANELIQNQQRFLKKNLEVYHGIKAILESLS